MTDHLGTVRDVVDNAGVVVNHISYDTFGNVTAETNVVYDIDFGYTGKLFDITTGLQNNLNRWYDSSVGKWISEDPIGFAAGDANLSRYVGNASTIFVDPSGLWSWGGIGNAFVEGVIGGIVGGAIVVGIGVGAVAIGIPAGVVTGAIFVGGVIGGGMLIFDVLEDPSPNNIANNAGALLGGCVVGGLSGRYFATRLSPPGNKPAPGWKAWDPRRDYGQNWRFDRTKPYGPQLYEAACTGPNPLSAAGSVGITGGGGATGKDIIGY